VSTGATDGTLTRKVVKAKTKAAVLRKMREVQGGIDDRRGVPDNFTTTGGWLA
jgi:hypothetical protein